MRRILLLIPYAIRNPGVTLSELSRRFGVSEKELMKDLDLVYLCGLPGYGPGDLIDVTIDGDRVFVGMADYFAAPLRMTPAEALTLYAGGAAIAELPGMEQAEALKRALAKLATALGDPERNLEVFVEPGPQAHLEALERALSDGKRVRLEYLSASRGELTDRDVDPWGLIAALGHWYLVGRDGLSGEERMFRTDRIKSVEILSRKADKPADFDPERYRGAFLGATGDRVTLEISPVAARWFEDYYPVARSTDIGDGWRRVELQSGGMRWSATLVLRLARDVRAVEPPEVLTEARRLAGAIASRYAGRATP